MKNFLGKVGESVGSIGEVPESQETVWGFSMLHYYICSING